MRTPSSSRVGASAVIGQLASVWHPEDSIFVWFTFKEAVASTLSFPIGIEAKDYTRQEFFELIKVKGEKELRNIIRRDTEKREESVKRDNKRKQLNQLVADLGDKLAVPYQLQNR